ncbi:MAG: FHA domain-containing protein [Mycobacteriales bacterium]
MKYASTHDPAGGGDPHLTFASGGQMTYDLCCDPAGQRIFHLPPGVSTIGSDESCDLCLEGLRPQHAQIYRNDADDYVIVNISRCPDLRVHGRTVPEAELHTGTRIELGPWVLCYNRAEFADHGRPNGGRQGGELSAGDRCRA